MVERTLIQRHDDTYKGVKTMKDFDVEKTLDLAIDIALTDLLKDCIIRKDIPIDIKAKIAALAKLNIDRDTEKETLNVTIVNSKGW